MANDQGIKYTVREGGNRFEDLENMYSLINNNLSVWEDVLRKNATALRNYLKIEGKQAYYETKIIPMEKTIKKSLYPALILQYCIDGSFENLANIMEDDNSLEDMVKHCPEDIKEKHARIVNILKDIRSGDIGAYADHVPASTYNQGSQMLH